MWIKMNFSELPSQLIFSNFNSIAVCICLFIKQTMNYNIVEFWWEMLEASLSLPASLCTWLKSEEKYRATIACRLLKSFSNALVWRISSPQGLGGNRNCNSNDSRRLSFTKWSNNVQLMPYEMGGGLPVGGRKCEWNTDTNTHNLLIRKLHMVLPQRCLWASGLKPATLYIFFLLTLEP